MKTPLPASDPAPDATGASVLVRRLRMRHLELLEILADAGTVRAAAGRMRLTQPAVTRMLKEIEELFCGQMFERSARGVSPNALGMLLVERAQVLMQEVRATEREVVLARQGQVGLLRIGTYSGSRAVLEAVARLTREDPRLTVELREAQINALLDALLRGDLDCVVGAVPPDELRSARIDQLRMERLRDDQISVVTPRDSPWARRRRVGWLDLAGERWVLPPRDSLLRRAFVQVYLELGTVPPAAAVESMSPLNVRTLVALHAGNLGLMRSEHAKEEQDLGALRIVPVTPPLTLPPLVVFTRHRPRVRQALVDRFVAAVRAAQVGGRIRTHPK
ncbi:LysR family transcriptional regulator [Burkholderiaceae bacterium FT117]|uniref:LysR family transcriptional regulator n=1 Tax=Zeimonas sediminis TaxID=2944268 RepID=UPI002342C867|nr:LysR family transcriptional regulator [Zeimonas sediminis]MCM5571157.1 LysR family transcriptional regulator [Zeimonas sediminis]